MVTVSKKSQTYRYPIHFTVVLGLYLKQYSFQNKFGEQRTGLEFC